MISAASIGLGWWSGELAQMQGKSEKTEAAQAVNTVLAEFEEFADACGDGKHRPCGARMMTIES
jgi:hypothetical protein